MADVPDISLATLLQKLSDEIQRDASGGVGEDAELPREACARRLLTVLQRVLRHCVEQDSGAMEFCTACVPTSATLICSARAGVQHRS